MSDIKINELLSQIRSISSQLEPDININQNSDESEKFSFLDHSPDFVTGKWGSAGCTASLFA